MEVDANPLEDLLVRVFHGEDGQQHRVHDREPQATGDIRGRVGDAKTAANLRPDMPLGIEDAADREPAGQLVEIRRWSTMRPTVWGAFRR